MAGARVLSFEFGAPLDHYTTWMVWLEVKQFYAKLLRPCLILGPSFFSPHADQSCQLRIMYFGKQPSDSYHGDGERVQNDVRFTILLGVLIYLFWTLLVAGGGGGGG